MKKATEAIVVEIEGVGGKIREFQSRETAVKAVEKSGSWTSRIFMVREEVPNPVRAPKGPCGTFPGVDL